MVINIVKYRLMKFEIWNNKHFTNGKKLDLHTLSESQFVI